MIQGAEREAAQARALKDASAGNPRLAGQMSQLVKLVKVHLDETPGLEANNHPPRILGVVPVGGAAEHVRNKADQSSKVLASLYLAPRNLAPSTRRAVGVHFSRLRTMDVFHAAECDTLRGEIHALKNNEASS